MMENHPYQFSNYDRNKNAVSPSYLPQAFPEIEDAESNWSFSEFCDLLRRRAIIIFGVSSFVMFASIIYLKLNQKPPEYESSFQILVEPVNDDSTAVDVVKETNSNSNSTSALDYESQIQVLKSPEIIGGIIRNLQSDYPEINYDNLIEDLQINRLAETKIIEVKYHSYDPEKTKFVLDKISQEYVEYSQERRQTKLRQGMQFVEKQLPFLQNRVDNVQRELQAFRLNYKFNDPEGEAKQIDDQIAKLSEQRQNVDIQLGQARSNLDIFQGKEGATSALNNAVLYQQLLAQIRQLDSQIAQESTRLQSENPTIKALQDKRESLLPLLRNEAQRYMDVKLSEIATQVQTLEVQGQEIDKTIQKLEQKRKTLPALARKYNVLQRKLQITTESLNKFLSTRENLQLRISQTELGWQLLKMPIKPELPANGFDKKRNLIMALITSLVAGVGVAVIIDKVDKTYHSANDLKEKLKLPLLGNIPFEKQLHISLYSSSERNISLARIPNFPDESNPGLAVIPGKDYRNHSVQFLEALRVLYTNIQLLSCDRQMRSIIISSAMSGDGKSTVAFHLAQIATAMGQRVLLVDANLRQPVIHSLSHLNNLWGLSNLISTNLPPEEVIRKLPSMSQLSVLTAGPIPPDPTKLLSSEKMKRLMADFHNNFDLVIYDTPPLLGLADASLLAPNTDGILLVVRIDKTDSAKVEQTLDHLKISPMNVLGIVGNGQSSNLND